MWFDLFLIIMVLGGLALGAWKGLTWQLAGIASIVLGLVLASPLASTIAGHFENPGSLATYLIFAVAYALIALACHLVAILIRAGLKRMQLDGFDRHLGALAGAVQALVLCAVVAIAASAFSPGFKANLAASPSGHIMTPVTGIVKDVMNEVLPEDLAFDKLNNSPSLN